MSRNTSFVNFDNDNPGTYLTCNDDDYIPEKEKDNKDDIFDALKEYNDLNIEIDDTDSCQNYSQTQHNDHLPSTNHKSHKPNNNDNIHIETNDESVYNTVELLDFNFVKNKKTISIIDENLKVNNDQYGTSIVESEYTTRQITSPEQNNASSYQLKKQRSNMFNINLKDKLEIININSDVDCDTARTDQSIQITSEYLND